jgi:hypothetical protein
MTENEKMNIVDSASLTFFTNPHYYNILQRKKLCNINDNAEEIKFYRKRIVALFKNMLKEPTETVNKEIKEIHTMFLNAAIHYFQMTDKKDIIQGQHIQSENIQGQHIQGPHIQIQDDVSGNELSPEDLLNIIGGPEIFTLDEANDMMMRKTIVMASLDNYVINKQEKNEKRIIPMKMDIDLKAIDLKTKGIPPKKTNK